MDYFIIKMTDFDNRESETDFYCESFTEASEIAYEKFDSEPSIKSVQLYLYDMYSGALERLLGVSKEGE